eukprot:2698970-Karenia_brevis.AAC.1
MRLDILPQLATQTFLEMRGITAPTYADYRQRVVTFLNFCLKNQLNWDNDEQLDSILIVWMDIMFWEGQPPDAGGKLLAAV